MPWFGEPLYEDRTDAGCRLARALARPGREEALVLGLARGGVIVAAEIARVLGRSLEVLIVRKIGAPANPEHAVGAIVEGDEPVISQPTVEHYRLSAGTVSALVDEQRREIERLRRAYGGSEPVALAGRDVVLVDDGLATGLTMIAAVAAARRRGARRITVACPVGSPAALASLRERVDELVCLAAPPDFFSVGEYYRHFGPVADDEVSLALAAFRVRS